MFWQIVQFSRKIMQQFEVSRCIRSSFLATDNLLDLLPQSLGFSITTPIFSFNFSAAVYVYKSHVGLSHMAHSRASFTQ